MNFQKQDALALKKRRNIQAKAKSATNQRAIRKKRAQNHQN